MEKGKSTIKIIRPIIAVCVVIFILIVIWLTTLYLSDNYERLLIKPKMSGNVMDFRGWQETNEDKISTFMDGDWLLYYNKFIITDNLDDEIGDLIISSPKRWTGKKLNGEKLSNEGFGSFKSYIRGLKGGSSVLLYTKHHIGSYRVFVNGHLNVNYGSVAKEFKATSSGGRANFLKPYVTQYDDELLEVVIEVGNDLQGGIHSSPTITINYPAATGEGWESSFGNISLGIMLMLGVTSFIINIGLSKVDRSWMFLALNFVLILLYITSSDYFYHLTNSLIDYNIYINYNFSGEIFHFIAVLLGFTFVCHTLKEKVIQPPKAYLISLIAFNIVMLVFYALLIGSNYRIIPITLQLLSATSLAYYLEKGRSQGSRYTTLYLLLLILLTAVLLLYALGLYDIIGFQMNPIMPSGSLLIGILIMAINFVKVNDASKEALRAAELEKQIISIKTEALKAQIKPHFIFNSLTVIESLYHQDIKKGDEAMALFSRHLRLNVDADNKELVTFENEIDNILNYVKLEEIGRDKKVPLLFDIEFDAFSVPILSLQPIIENSIKYSGVLDNPEGYIQIRTFIDGKDVILEISDNGKGADLTAIRKKGKGIINTKERFKYVLGGEMQVISKKGKGMITVIRLPLNK